MNAILVSVDFADLLSLSLPYNRRHFDRVVVVTHPRDLDTQQVCLENDAEVYLTDAFYRQGAHFNKWAALEHGLDWMGRSGWICLMDADILWPKSAQVEKGGYLYGHKTSLHFSGPLMPLGCSMQVGVGQLITPLRRMMEDISTLATKGIPPESDWSKYPIHRNVGEWAGYSQIFNAEDSVLGPPPWHETNWAHCGGADSFFQAKWPRERKVRPPFEVLHLGQAGVNWTGRASRYLDGTDPPESSERMAKVARIWIERRGKVGPDRFRGERLDQ
jgi:hypothetical protein